MSIDLNLALQALDNAGETIVIKPNGKNYRKKFKDGRYRYTKLGKLISASASNKNGFNISNVKPKNPKK